MSDNIFADIPVKGETQTRKKTLYTKVVAGQPLRMRILDTKAYRVVKHFLPKQRISVVCEGNDCPVCNYNRKLVDQNPGIDYNEIPGIINRQTRFLVNVLNRTSVKKVGDTEVYFANQDGRFPTMTDKGVDLTSIKPEPLNTVELLEKGPTLFGQFNAIDNSFRTDTGEKIGINNFDIILMATGKGKNMVITAVPAMQYSDPVSVADDAKYDLEKASISFTKDEVWKLLDGVPTQDIFEARKAASVRESADSQLTEVVTDLEKSLDEFFED